MLNKAVFTRTINKPEADKLQILSNPNLLDNGNFQVSQRGTNFTVSRQRIYTFDRWIVGSDDGAVTVERSDGLLVTCTEAGGALISQVISMEETNLRGQTITLAVDCEYAPGTSPSLCLYSNEGSGYHLLKIIYLSAESVLTAVIPNDAIFIAFEVNSAGVPLSPGQFIRLKYAKLETGPCFTGFLPIPYAEDLRRCQRYYQRSKWMTLRTATIDDKVLMTTEHYFFTPMRIAPFIRALRPDVVYNIRTIDGNLNIITPTAEQISPIGIAIGNNSMFCPRLSLGSLEVKEYTLQFWDDAYEFDANL